MILPACNNINDNSFNSPLFTITRVSQYEEKIHNNVNHCTQHARNTWKFYSINITAIDSNPLKVTFLSAYLLFLNTTDGFIQHP